MKFVTTMHKQRFTLGAICGLLPIYCILFGLFGKDINYPNWWYSISATYYATSSPWMIGSLVLSSFFFFTYQGYDLGDKWFTNLSSICSLGIIIFPCKNEYLNNVGIFQLPTAISSIFHNMFAVILFSSFGLMILCRFTKGTDAKRNLIYTICGIAIFISIILLIVSSILKLPGWLTIIYEFIILEAFAFAWILKSDITHILRKTK